MTRNTNVCKQQIQCLMFLFQYMFKTSNFDRYVFVKCHYLVMSICCLVRVFVVTSNNKRKIKPMLLKSHPTYKFSTQIYTPFIHDFYRRNFDFQSYIYMYLYLQYSPHTVMFSKLSTRPKLTRIFYNKIISGTLILMHYFYENKISCEF